MEVPLYVPVTIVNILGPFSSVSVILSQWKGDKERLCAMKQSLAIEYSLSFTPIHQLDMTEIQLTGPLKL